MIDPRPREARRCERCLAFTFAAVPAPEGRVYCSEACREMHAGTLRPRRHVVRFQNFTEVRLA